MNDSSDIALDVSSDNSGQLEFEDGVSLETTEGSDEGDLVLGQSHEGVRIDKNDRSLSEFKRWYEEGRLVIDPEWQRSYVWDMRRASKCVVPQMQ